jgi:hypothetical protein
MILCWSYFGRVTAPTDGDAVAFVRALLAEQRVPRNQPWRSTVVSNDKGGWIVRTWTRTPQEQPRPVGAPDYVHDVVPDLTLPNRLRVEQVSPETPSA